MTIIILLIMISLFIAVGFLVSFLWNMKSGQYDDTYSPSVRMLFDDKVTHTQSNKDKDGKHTTSDSTIKKV
jgi:cbb3-type cytochrome oxidase maturation protein